MKAVAKPHPQLCQCDGCAGARFERVVENLEVFTKANGIRPTNSEQTVMVKSFRVRAHFRRNPHHMNGDPALKARVEDLFARFRAENEALRSAAAADPARRRGR